VRSGAHHTTQRDFAEEIRSAACWLGPSDRPLFTRLDTPAAGLIVGAVVVCPTMGLEAAYSARAVGDLARRLAASGWAALRVDYPGMGDSSGSWTDPDLVADWLNSIRGAIDYARALDAPRIALVGMRIGATLAAEVAGDGGVDDLVLWDPCATGKAFLREQRALWSFLRDQATEWGTLREGEVWGSGEAIGDGSVEAPGVLFSANTTSDLERLAAAPSGQALASRELLLFRKGRKPPRALADRLVLPRVESVEIAGQEALLDTDAVTPEATLEQIVSWLSDGARPVVRIGEPETVTTAVLRSEGGTAVQERAIDIGPARLFGILTEPSVGPAAGLSAIFLNAGRIGHDGPARLWVDLARSWASEGIRCLRVDLSGIGDSPTRPGRTELVEFPADALHDLSDVRRAMSTEPESEHVLVGLCSGGYHAIESALMTPGASVCVINPALAYYRPVEPPPRRFEPSAELGFSDRKAWGATRPRVSRLVGQLDPLRRAARRIPGVWWAHKRFLVTASPARTFERLAQSGADALLIVGNVEERKLCRGERRRFRSLVRKGHLQVETVPGLEHTLFERTGREHVSEVLHSYVARRAAATGASNVGAAAPS
jgi:pimeloyl-ACP methyl ester carboxylesterase